MPLSQEQRDIITAEAEKRGVDPAKLLAVAEKAFADRTKEGADDARSPADRTSASGDSTKPAVAETRPLYQYHLPFVTVDEVRTIWLGLGELPGGAGKENAAKYAAQQLAAAATKPAPDAT